MTVPPLFAALVFVPGLAIGSFLNVVAARVPDHRSIVRPRSACGGCGKEIAWHDNIPLLSYALLGGKCRNCKNAIGIVYPAVELTVAALIVGCVVRFGVTLTALVASVFCATLVTVSVTDLQRRVIPNWIVLPAAARRARRDDRWHTPRRNGRSAPWPRARSCSSSRSPCREGWAWAT